MIKDEKAIEVFSTYTESPEGLYIHTEDCKKNFFIRQRDDNEIMVVFSDNSDSSSEVVSCDNIALSISDENDGLYKLIFVGYKQSSTEQVEYTFHTTQDVKEQVEEFISNCPSYIVSISSSIYQCIYKGMKLRVEYPKPNSIFEELIQSSIFGAMKKHLCDYEKWFNEPYMRDPYTFGNRINPNAIVLDKGGYLLNGEEYDKGGNKKQKESD